MTGDTHYSLGLADHDRVDQAFGGGLPRGSVTLIEGVDGTGKSVLTQRMAYGMATEGAHVAVVSTELTAKAFVDQMHSLSYDVVDQLLSEQLLFLHADVDTHRYHGEGVRGKRGLLSRFMDDAPIWKADVVVVDEFGAFLRNDPAFDSVAETDDEDHLVQRLVRFLRQVTASGRAVVLTVNPTQVSERALRPLRDVADVYLELQRSTVGQEIRREMRVTRFAGMRNQVDDTIGYTVQRDRGIIIVNRTVA